MRALPALLAFSVLTVWAQTCLVCGEIRSIREVSERGKADVDARTPGAPGTSSGLDTAPVVGTVAQFSFDRGKSEGWRFGAAGTPEMQARLGETSYEITVAMDDGERRTIQRRDGNRFQVGQRVALRGGELDPM
jgi:outer membrane lipoprotein SlyB